MLSENLDLFLNELRRRGVKVSSAETDLFQVGFQKSSAVISAGSDELGLHIKRIMTDHEHKGEGHATRLMTELIIAAGEAEANLSLVPVIFGAEYSAETHKKQTQDVIRLYETLGFRGDPLMAKPHDTGLSMRSVRSLYPDICFAMNEALDASPDNVEQALTGVLSSKLQEINVPHRISPDGSLILSLLDGEHEIRISGMGEDDFPDYMSPSDLVSLPIGEAEASVPSYG